MSKSIVKSEYKEATMPTLRPDDSEAHQHQDNTSRY
jgi:hypothetical protein